MITSFESSERYDITALAADPPLEPPAMISTFQGLQVAPFNADSVEIPRANSGVVVRPSNINPAFFKSAVKKESVSATCPFMSLDPIS